jgi:hypothetical protein
MSLEDDMELLEHEWNRRFGATLWPEMLPLFSGTTVLRSAAQEEVDSYHRAEAIAARLPRNGKRLVLPRPLVRVCFIRPDGGTENEGSKIVENDND